MHHRGLQILSVIVLVMTGCHDADPGDANPRDAGDTTTDTSLVVVDAGPSAPTTATIVTPPDDLVVAPNSRPNANLIPIAVEVEGEAPDSIQLAVNGVPEDVLHEPYHYEWDISGRPDGIYKLSAWAIIEDRAYPGPSRIIEIDDGAFANLSPVIDVPSSRRSVDDSLVVRARIRGGAFSTVQFVLYADGETIQRRSASNFAEFEIDTSDWPEGTIELQVRVEVDDRSYWSLPRHVDVFHEPSPRFDAVGEPLEGWEDIDLEVGADGHPIAALTNRSGIQVFAWSPGEDAWTPLGSMLTQQFQPGLPDLEVGPEGEIFVAWTQPDASEPWENRRNAHIARWNPDQESWIRSGLALERDIKDDASSAALWLDDGVPYVAFSVQTSDNDDSVEVVAWDPASESWETVGAPIPATARAGIVSMGRNSQGALLLLWRASFRVFTHRYNKGADAWIANAMPPLDGFAGDAAWVDGAPTVPLFDRSGFRTMEADGVQWRLLDAGATPRPQSIGSVGGVAVDTRGRPVLAWLDYEENRDLYLSRWIDEQWEPLSTRPIEPDIESNIRYGTAAAGDERIFVGFVSQGDSGVQVSVREFVE